MAQQIDFHSWQQEQQLQGKRDALFTVLRARFSFIPEELQRRINAIDTPPVLDTLLTQAATASSLDEVRAALPD